MRTPLIDEFSGKLPFLSLTKTLSFQTPPVILYALTKKGFFWFWMTTSPYKSCSYFTLMKTVKSIIGAAFS